METQTEAQKLTLQITYNGVTKELTVESHATVKSALDHAIKLFGLADRVHLLSLWYGGEELQDTRSVASYNLPADAAIQLRPGAVKGG